MIDVQPWVCDSGVGNIQRVRTDWTLHSFIAQFMSANKDVDTKLIDVVISELKAGLLYCCWSWIEM